MPELLTKDHEAAQELHDTLSQTSFGNAENFVKYYSEGWLNTTNEDIRDIAQRISDTYHNIQLKGRKLTFVAQTESMIDEVIDGLTPWKALTRIKRALNEEYGEGDGDQEVCFSLENPGSIFTLDSEGELQKVSSEKFFRAEKEVLYLYEKFSTFVESESARAVNTDDVDGADEQLYWFKVSDLAEVDDSFITQIYEILNTQR